MTLSIVKVWTPTHDEWDHVWQTCPYSTYFQSREWFEIWSDYHNGRTVPAPLMVLLSDGMQILLPFSVENIFRGMAKRWIFSPAGTYGGWLANASLIDEQKKILLKFISERFGDFVWRMNPYESLPFLHDGIGVVTKEETHVLNLEGGFQTLLNAWKRDHSSVIRKANKAYSSGVRIHEATTGEDWREYYSVYENSLSRWGRAASSRYTWDLFGSIYLRASPHVKLWLARYRDEVIAGALCFYSPIHVAYWHGAALSNHFNLRPVNLLMYDVIRDAAERKFKWFDFNPSGGHEGVKAFKCSFGATPMSCDFVERISLRTRVVSEFVQFVRHNVR